MYVIEECNVGGQPRIVKDLYYGRVLNMTGTIKKIIRQNGYGFIIPDDGSDEVFFHRGSLAPRTQIEDFNEGDTVQFQTRKGEKGPVAFDMKVR